MRLAPIAAPEATCKCCGGTAPLFGVVDFHKNCEEVRRKVLALSGIPVYYHRCASCGFLFTLAFDGFTHEDFARWIYNAEYALVDPDCIAARPAATARLVADLLRDNKALRILDYGGGSGRLASNLRDLGFGDVHSWDPFLVASAVPPAGQYDCVLSFEVLEHSTDPRRTVNEILSMLRQPGIVVFSTVFQPPQIDQLGVGWWYVGPRNGHVSLFSRRSMEVLAQSLDCRIASFSDELHVLFREVPPFAVRWFGGN